MSCKILNCDSFDIQEPATAQNGAGNVSHSSQAQMKSDFVVEKKACGHSSLLLYKRSIQSDWLLTRNKPELLSGEDFSIAVCWLVLESLLKNKIMFGIILQVLKCKSSLQPGLYLQFIVPVVIIIMGNDGFVLTECIVKTFELIYIDVWFALILTFVFPKCNNVAVKMRP